MWPQLFINHATNLLCSLPRQISVITSGPRTIYRASKQNKQSLKMSPPGTIARNELDTRADTICAGSNFVCLSTTGLTCNVYGFHQSFHAIPEVPVATVATAWDDPLSGLTYILIVHQALYFGPEMDHSLINPNQIRVAGYSVCDDPFDRHRTLGIELTDFIVPFYTDGNTIFFTSRSPTLDELENCPAFHLTDDTDWDPSTVDLTDPHPKEGAVSIQSVQTLRHETDRILSQISPVLSEVEFSRTLTTSSYTTLRVEKAETQTRHSKFSPEQLAKIWNIGIGRAKDTLAATTQRGIRYAIHPIHRRYRVDHLTHLGLNSRRLQRQFYVDHLEARVKSLSQNTGAFVYTGGGFTVVYPVSSTSKAGETLAEFARDVGIPSDLRADLASYFVGRETHFVKEAKRLRIKLTYAEKGRHEQNYAAELEIRELKRGWNRKMVEKNIPSRLWDFGIVHRAELMTRMVRSKSMRTGYEIVTGDTPDISEWMDFDFYDLVWYHDPPDTMSGTTEEIRKLGRWLGVASRVGSALNYWVLTKACKVISRTTVQHVTGQDIIDENISTRIREFDKAVVERLDDTEFVIDSQFLGENRLDDIDIEDQVAYGDGTATPTDAEYRVDAHPPEYSEADDIGGNVYDEYIGAEILVDLGVEGRKRATVVKKDRAYDGRSIGRWNRNPMNDTRQYEVEYEDGTWGKVFANTIAANIYSKLDSEGNRYTLLQDIVDHRSDNTAIKKADGFVIDRNGRRTPKRTTRGWTICIEWKDGNISWKPLKDVIDSNPVELADYAVRNNIHEEPAFAWWVPTARRNHERIVSSMKKKYWRTEYKFGVRMPKNVDDAFKLDEETGTDHWRKALEKEMSKVSIAYKAKEGISPNDVRSGRVPDMIGYQEIKCHIIFDVKMDFTRKARFVAGGHMTEPAASMTYSSVVSRDSVRIALLLAALNDLKVLSCDVGNAYLNAPCREKIWFQAGRECGEDMGKVMIITRALYGLRTSGASWRQMLSDTLTSKEFGYFSSRGDQDVYLRRRSRPQSGDYYEMVLVFVDDILCVSHMPEEFMTKFGTVYDLRSSVEEPTIYLGANVVKHQLPNGTTCWGMSADTYIKNALENVNKLLFDDGRELRTSQRRGRIPIPTGYRPELDQSDLLDKDMISRYLQLIGILRWAIELGRVDIALETAIMSQYSASPRVGHIEAVYHIFAYLQANPRATMVFDPTTPLIDEGCFQHDTDWKPFYGDVKEELPLNMPEPLGLPVLITCFTDANHAGNVVTRRSHTGIILFLQNAPILWYSKKQNTVESSTFGSELVAMRVARDMISGLRTKLRMMGIPLDGPANILCDNQGVVKNTSIPESTLNKKHNAINYHAIREAAAMEMLRVGKEDTETNLADLLTKPLNQPRREKLLQSILYFPVHEEGGEKK